MNDEADEKRQGMGKGEERGKREGNGRRAAVYYALWLSPSLATICIGKPRLSYFFISLFETGSVTLFGCSIVNVSCSTFVCEIVQASVSCMRQKERKIKER